MKLALKLAYRNLLGAGLRTWLNVIVLSFSFVVIIWMKGILVGWDHQAKTDMIQWEIGGGQYWHTNYDPYDPFTLSESHAEIPDKIQPDVKDGKLVPVLITQGTIYPEGRMQSILVKGIPINQELLKIPSSKLDTSLSSATPAIIGASMARRNKLKQGDYVTLQWRDAKGTFDATEIFITGIFSTNVPGVDVGQVWVSLDKLQEMMVLPNQATLITYSESWSPVTLNGWDNKTYKSLTADIDEMIKTKSVGQSVFYIILLLLAMLAVFDTQVLSIFRRQKEIGTYIALGYTRSEVVWLFTVEGAMHAVLAAIVSAVYGVPFLLWQAKTGWSLPVEASDYGMAMAETLYPVYSGYLIFSTVFIVMITTAVVSYWPSKKIAKMNPTEALRGKIQ